MKARNCMVGLVEALLLLPGRAAADHITSIGSVDWFGAVFEIEYLASSGDQYDFEYRRTSRASTPRRRALIPVTSSASTSSRLRET